MASLHKLFERIPDPRSRLGRRHPLSSILSQAAVAMLAGARSYEAMAQFGRDRGAPFAEAVGYTREEMPCKATFSNVFRALPAWTFERALRCWLAEREGTGWKRASVDGKTLRGSGGDQLPGVDLLAAFDHEAKAAIAQMAVDGKTNEHKAALEMLDVIELQGKVVTSLVRDEADAKDLLELTRGHWSIENRLFHTRDVTFGEDACRVRSGHGPQNLAAIRNAAITLLNDAGHANKAAAQRRFAARPQEALTLVRGP